MEGRVPVRMFAWHFPLSGELDPLSDVDEGTFLDTFDPLTLVKSWLFGANTPLIQIFLGLQFLSVLKQW